MADTYFIQFSHPGPEHVPKTNEMTWNAKDHKRKFLVSPGRYVDGGQLTEAELVFWGEWEAPSTVEHRWPKEGELPRALHRPWWFVPHSKEFRQNTDPWVFGPSMIFSNCRQTRPTNTGRKSTELQQLGTGSIISFGSRIRGAFCLDTLFVVASAEPWTPRDAEDLALDEAFKVCTADSIATKKEDVDLKLTLYRGATFEQPVNGMFSFVPSRRVDDEKSRFPRPPIQSELIDVGVWRQARGYKKPLTADRLHEAWTNVRDQVLDAGLLLGAGFSLPLRRMPPATPTT